MRTVRSVRLMLRRLQKTASKLHHIGAAEIRAANKTTVHPPGGRGRCSESACTTRTLRFLRAVHTHLTTARYVLLATLKQVQHKRCTIGRGNLRMLDRIPSRPLVLAMCIAAIAWVTPAAVAHPGGLNKQGCHNDRKNGGYHCHRSASGERKPTAAAEPLDRSQWTPWTGAVFRNCAEARAAGAAPVRRGDPGYGPHLDRDHDGVGCEPSRRR